MQQQNNGFSYSRALLPIALALACCGSIVVLAGAPPASSSTIAQVPRPLEGILSMGQPTPQQIEDAARAGVRTVINLRTDAEGGFEWEQAAVEGLGMRYVRIPIAGADDLTRDNVKRLDDVLREDLARGQVLLHCASGNRNGALLALREAWMRGASPEAALEVGRAAGLTRFAPETRALLGLPAEVTGADPKPTP